MKRATIGRPLRTAARLASTASAVLVVGCGAVAGAVLVAGEMPGERWQVAPVLGAAATTAVAWPVVRRRTDEQSDRLVLGSKRDPSEVLRSFEAGSRSDIDLTELLVQMSESLVRTFAAVSGEVWLADGERLDRTVSVPSARARSIALGTVVEQVLAGGGVLGRSWLELWLPDLLEQPMADRRADRGDPTGAGEIRVVPATHAGALLGIVVVRRVAGAVPFEAAEDAALAELGPRIGVVLHNRRLDAALQATLADLRRSNEELRASRVRLVSTADAERRRIERDLHDGAQQQLVALAVNLRLADDAIAADPTSSREVLGALAVDLRSAIVELRSLAHGIFPPLLTDAGLVEALRVAADRSPSEVAFTARDVGRHRTEVEAAVYFCCTEALQNAAKHAPGADVRLHVEAGDGIVRFRVDDDGPGPAGAEISAGHGLSNMADRIGALGGTFRMSEAPSGGTRVTGEVPLTGSTP